MTSKVKIHEPGTDKLLSVVTVGDNDADLSTFKWWVEKMGFPFRRDGDGRVYLHSVLTQRHGVTVELPGWYPRAVKSARSTGQPVMIDLVFEVAFKHSVPACVSCGADPAVECRWCSAPRCASCASSQCECLKGEP